MGRNTLVDKVANSFQKEVEKRLANRLHAFYIVGSYTFGKISQQRPDVNFLLIFDGYTAPDDYLVIGEICRDIEKKYSKQVTIKFEFRPFRYIKPRFKNKLEMSINPIIISTNEIEHMGGVIFNKWFTTGLKSSNKIIQGKDYLKELKSSKVTRKDLIKGAVFDLSFFSIPLSRAPAQYDKKESNLLLNESLVNAKNIAYLGIEAAMTDKELADKDYVKYMVNKEKIAAFYKERYGIEISKMIGRIFEVRRNYLKYKDDSMVAEEMFEIALSLTGVVRYKLES